MLLRYAEGHDSTGKREEGFLEAMKAHPSIEVVSSNQYGGADVEGAYKKTEALLSGYKKPDGSLGVDGIFCVERIVDVRGDARAAGQRLGRQGEVRRLRRVRRTW